MTGTHHVFEWTNEGNDTGKCQPPQPGISLAAFRKAAGLPGHFYGLSFDPLCPPLLVRGGGHDSMV